MLFCVVVFVLLACGLPLTEPPRRLPRPSPASIHSRKARAFGQGPRSGPAGLGLDRMHASGTPAGVTDGEPGKKRDSFFLRVGCELFQKHGNIRRSPRRCARAEFDGFRIPTVLAARPPCATADGDERKYLRQTKQSVIGYILHGLSPVWLGSANCSITFFRLRKFAMLQA